MKDGRVNFTNPFYSGSIPCVTLKDWHDVRGPGTLKYFRVLGNKLLRNFGRGERCIKRIEGYTWPFGRVRLEALFTNN